MYTVKKRKFKTTIHISDFLWRFYGLLKNRQCVFCDLKSTVDLPTTRHFHHHLKNKYFFAEFEFVFILPNLATILELRSLWTENFSKNLKRFTRYLQNNWRAVRNTVQLCKTIENLLGALQCVFKGLSTLLQGSLLRYKALLCVTRVSIALQALHCVSLLKNLTNSKCSYSSW